MPLTFSAFSHGNDPSFRNASPQFRLTCALPHYVPVHALLAFHVEGHTFAGRKAENSKGEQSSDGCDGGAPCCSGAYNLQMRNIENGHLFRKMIPYYIPVDGKSVW